MTPATPARNRLRTPFVCATQSPDTAPPETSPPGTDPRERRHTTPGATFTTRALEAIPTTAALQAALELSKGTQTLGGAVAVALLVVLSGFFSSSEIAMFSLADHRVEAMVEAGEPGAALVETLKSDPHRLLVTILVGNNVVNIAMASISTTVLALHFSPTQSVLIATFGITALVLLFGESAPKSYAVEHPESWARTIARPLQLSEYLMYPLVVVFDF